jgi:hypothetical protein
MAVGLKPEILHAENDVQCSAPGQRFLNKEKGNTPEIPTSDAVLNEVASN